MLKLIYITIILLVLSVLTCGKEASARRVPANAKEAIVAHHITAAAKRHRVERYILSCVIYTESSYRAGLVSDTSDYGIAQINISNIKAYNLDKDRLLNDSGYSINFAAQLLAEYRRSFKGTEVNQWFARYNIGHQRLTKVNIGAAYVAYSNKVWSCVHSGTYL